MSTQKVSAQAPGESFLATEPELLQQVDPGWHHRLSLFTGRALSDIDLGGEQKYRSGRLALLGQIVTRGTAKGLDTTIDAAGLVSVIPGYGVTATGEDVTLERQLQAKLDDLTVLDGITGGALSTKSFGELRANAATKGGPFILLLQPITARVTGEEINTGVPTLEVCGNVACSCTRDPDRYAFEDQELVEGVRLALVNWPNPAGTLKLPDANPATTFRNRLAYTIFNVELALGPDEFLPWEGIGVPLGIAFFGVDWKLQFFDRNAVIRMGGRSRRLQLYSVGWATAPAFNLALHATAEARLVSLLEHNTQLKSADGLSAFAFLPPTGILPISALDLANRKNGAFPNNWKLHVAPIHAEEVETALRSQMFAAPFDLTQPEEIDVLLPLTDDVYDPAVLQDEVIDPVFAEEQKKATDTRNAVLQHRRFLQREANALRKVTGDDSIDLSAGLSTDEQDFLKQAPAYKPDNPEAEAFGTTVVNDQPASTDVQNLQKAAAAAPYTVTVGSDTIPLIAESDWKILEANGLQAFMDDLQGRVNKVDDLLNLHFLQTQTNVYRYRTNVMNGTDAARLITSPIVANIAQRESAVATAQDLKAYLDTIGKDTTPVIAAPQPSQPAGGGTGRGGSGTGGSSTGGEITRRVILPNINESRVNNLGTSFETPTIRALAGMTRVTPAAASGAAPAAGRGVTLAEVTKAPPLKLSAVFTTGGGVDVSGLPSQTKLPTGSDVTSQLPLAGTAFNLRTLNIAERLKTSPSHEALLYTASAREAMIEQLLAPDLGITVADLEVLVAEQDKTAFNFTTLKLADIAKPKTPTDAGTDAQKKKDSARSSLYAKFVSGGLASDADEATVFSGGILSLDHHTLLLRAVEARVALYRQFLSLAARALASVQQNLDQLSAKLKSIENDLADARHNLSFVLALTADENKRIEQVKARRKQVLTNVPFLVFMRRRTITPQADVPSRQLMPANISSPVPAALAADVIIPPELHELAALLREAPPAWLPAIYDLLGRIERPQNFIDLATHMQVRAYTRLQLPQAQSSATTHPGPYGPHIADIFGSQQSQMLPLVQQRAAYDLRRITTLSWTEQREEIFRVSSINDVIGSEAVPLEITNGISTLIRDVSKIATAMYIRASAALPAERLGWAEFLVGAGRFIGLRTLSVLPGWANHDYIDRQQMQMLVDWLFSQVNTGIEAAASYVSDLVRTAILLASHASVTDIIAGEVSARTPIAIGSLVKLTSDSVRVARGMPVLLYQSGTLAARAVVDDLSATQISARFTDVYTKESFLETSSQVHFVNQDPKSAVVTRSSLKLR